MAATKLNGHQKAAILLLTLGEDAAGEVLKFLNEDEIRDVARSMTRFESITPADVNRVFNEYHVRTEQGVLPPVPLETKSRFLQRVLAKAVGEERGEVLMQGLLSSPAGGALETLKWHTPRSVANFIASEHPQVIAVILATMDEPGLADKVLAALPPDMQREIVQRIAEMTEISAERLRDIEETLAEAMRPDEGPYKEDSGLQRVAEVLNTAPSNMEKAILSQIETHDPEMAERIRDRMLRFDDFLMMDNLGIQKVLNQSTIADLVLALRAAGEALREHVMANLSTRTAKQIEEELADMGPTRVAEIEAAQQRLIAIARGMIEKGELALLGKPGVIP